MAIYKLDKKGIADLEKMMRNRVSALKCRTAAKAYEFLYTFQYHARSGGSAGSSPGGYTFLYAVNWNCSVGSPDLSVSGTDRGYVSTFDPAGWGTPGQFAQNGNKDKAINTFQFDKLKIDEALYVSNSVSYGKDLNQGNNWWSFKNGNSLIIGAEPNRFIELCEAHLRDNISSIVTSVRNEVH